MDDFELGPDPNRVRRHAKKMLTEIEYRKKYCRLDFYRPNRKQLVFHNTVARERMLRAGNQEGKTHGIGAQMAMDAIALYPDWYAGRRFIKPPPIERPFEFLGWAGCTSSVTTRDGIQTKLFGDITQDGGLGTGLIPLDNIVGRPAMARGIADFIDNVSLRRETGGNALIRLKTFEMDRKAWQGEAVDEIWIDEDPGDDVIYGECTARLTTTRGQIVVSMTPVLGQTPIRRRFKTKHPGTGEILMTIDDALVSNGGHIPDEDLPVIVAGYKESERQTRLYGADMQGEGAVFETPIDRIKHANDPATFPPYWRWMWALDFRHSGSGTGGHPFAAVLGCRDPDLDVIYVTHAIRMFGLAPNHVAAIKESPMWMAPVAWPHDGGRGAGILSGDTIAATYKKLGLNMRPTHATFHTGGYNFEAGLDEMRNRFATGRLLIASHLAPVLDEYQGYHMVNGLVNKVDDDLLSAIRVLCMDIRYAQATERFYGFATRRRDRAMVADGMDFDVFTGGPL
jgi:phage terminase large subunit-like protein